MPGDLRRREWFDHPDRANLASRLRSRTDRVRDPELRRHLSAVADRWEEVLADVPPKRKFWADVEKAASDEGQHRGRQERAARVGVGSAKEALARLSHLESTI